MFLFARYFAKGSRMPFRQEDRIVTKAEAAARRKNELAKNLAFEALHLSAWKGEGKGASEMGLEWRACLRRAQRLFDFFHGGAEIPRMPRPTRGIDAWSAFERFDTKARIVGERGDVCANGSGARLDFRIGDERSAGFLRLRQTEFGRCDCHDAIGREEFAHLGKLARIMRCDDEFSPGALGDTRSSKVGRRRTNGSRVEGATGSPHAKPKELEWPYQRPQRGASPAPTMKCEHGCCMMWNRIFRPRFILMRMRGCFFLVFFLGILGMAETARATPPWLSLPPTPTLPAPEESGAAPVNGIKIWYAEFGHGEPVILLHGGLANANYWGNQVPALAKHLPGHCHGQPRPRAQHARRRSPSAMT